jgi:carbonic anhydrase
MNVLDTFLDRNARFAEANFKPDLKMMPSTGTILVGCVDPRVDPAVVLGLEQGEVAVIRNVGGRVNKALIETLAILRVVAKAAGREDGVRHLVLLHHTDCGIIGCHHHAPELLARHLGIEPDALENHAIDDPYASVVQDIAALQAISQLPGDIIVSGLVYDVATGRVETVVAPAQLRPPV